jgi:hypothetical protein
MMVILYFSRCFQFICGTEGADIIKILVTITYENYSLIVKDPLILSRKKHWSKITHSEVLHRYTLRRSIALMVNSREIKPNRHTDTT